MRDVECTKSSKGCKGYTTLKAIFSKGYDDRIILEFMFLESIGVLKITHVQSYKKAKI